MSVIDHAASGSSAIIRDGQIQLEFISTVLSHAESHSRGDSVEQSAGQCHLVTQNTSFPHSRSGGKNIVALNFSRYLTKKRGYVGCIRGVSEMAQRPGFRCPWPLDGAMK